MIAGSWALSSFFEVMLKRLVFRSPIVLDKGLKPLAPHDPLTADLGFWAI